jgi:hypothetical protein
MIDDPSQPAESDDDNAVEETPAAPHFPELELLQQEVARRIRDNQKFLEGFLDDDYIDDDPATVEDDETPEDFEEL